MHNRNVYDRNDRLCHQFEWRHTIKDQHKNAIRFRICQTLDESKKKQTHKANGSWNIIGLKICNGCVTCQRHSHQIVHTHTRMYKKYSRRNESGQSVKERMQTLDSVTKQCQAIIL